MLHNPLDVEVERTIRLPLHDAGLGGAAVVRVEDGAPRRLALARDASLTLPVRIPARGRTFLTIEAP
jgi:hypothetical protein